jgi:hypothetical protein
MGVVRLGRLMEALNINQQLLDAFSLIRPHYPQFSTEQILETLLICQQNGGLWTYPTLNPRTLLAGFRYHPLSMMDARRMLAVVQEFDIEALKRCDLTRGPCLHVVAFVTPTKGYTVFRSMIDVLNPFTISVHRWNHGAFRFRLKKNRHYKPKEHDENN